MATALPYNVPVHGNKENFEDINNVYRLLEIFPDACPYFLREFCHARRGHNVDFLIESLLQENNNYPKREIKSHLPSKLDSEDYLAMMENCLPEADPRYLNKMYKKFHGDPEKIMVFIEQKLETKDYPTKENYLKEQQLLKQQHELINNFNVKEFLKQFPNPQEHFGDLEIIMHLSDESMQYFMAFLKNHFKHLSVTCIRTKVRENDKKIRKILHTLKTFTPEPSNLLKHLRKPTPLPIYEQNIELLYELAYFEHQDKIIEYVNQQKLETEKLRHNCKVNGLFKKCECCFDEEVLPTNEYFCRKGCSFCKECIQKSVELQMGLGKFNFPCLSNCDSEFSLHTLEEVLNAKMFSKLYQKKIAKEIESAGLEDLEACPFCDFVNTQNDMDKIFHCLNPDCKKMSCRLCKKMSHIPFKCGELEEKLMEEDRINKARIFVENQMTEALLRKCYACGVKYFKEEGCNKMTCVCGAMMCYLCLQPVKDYTHFNGQGGNRFDLCPLFSDTISFNRRNVIIAKHLAKKQVRKSAVEQIVKRQKLSESV